MESDTTYVSYFLNKGDDIAKAQTAFNGELLAAVSRHLQEFKAEHLLAGANENDYDVYQFQSPTDDLVFIWVLAPANMKEPSLFQLVEMGCPCVYNRYEIEFAATSPPPSTQR